MLEKPAILSYNSAAAEFQSYFTPFYISICIVQGAEIFLFFHVAKLAQGVL